MIELKDVSKQYLYGARVLYGVNLTIGDGEIVAVLGDEQSGKTSLLKSIAGVTECEGEVRISGEKIEDKPDYAIMVFDDLALFENRSCYYNLAYPLKIRGYYKADIDKIVKESASRMGITAILYDKMRKVPLIDKKRLAIARLLIRDTKAILVDEITRGLDKDEAYVLWNEVVPVLLEKAREGKSVIFATRDKDEALSISDRMVVMHYREIKQIGTCDDILAHPSNVWAIEAIDKDYHFEKVALTNGESGLECTTKDGYTFSVDYLDGKVAADYIGKDVLAGWRSDCFDLCSARTERVDYTIREQNGYSLVTRIGRIKSDKNLESVGTLPQNGKVSLFDAIGENSILVD